MAGYWPSSSFASLWTETESRSINSQKKNEAKIGILTEQAWSIKDLLYGFRGNFSCGTRQVVPSGQYSSILPARVANHSVIISVNIYAISAGLFTFAFEECKTKRREKSLRSVVSRFSGLSYFSRVREINQSIFFLCTIYRILKFTSVLYNEDGKRNQCCVWLLCAVFIIAEQKTRQHSNHHDV